MELYIALAAGTVLMLAVTVYLRKFYQITLWKIVLLTLMLTVFGLLGTKILFLIETGRWSGTSYFGAVFFTPLFMMLVAKALRLSIGDTLDLCAPAECIMLALMKVKCLIYGCCDGRLLYATKEIAIRFPSQIVELVAALVIMVLLILLIKKGEKKNQIYAWYMIYYGVSRFVLNCLRDTEPFVGILPAGNFWALISIGIGVVLIYHKKKKLDLNDDK